MVEKPIVEEVHSHTQETYLQESSADKKKPAIDHLPVAVRNEGTPSHETHVAIQDAPKTSYSSIISSIQSNLRLSCPTLDCKIVTEYLMEISGRKRVRVMKENAALSVAVQKPSLARFVPSVVHQVTTSSPPKESTN